MSIPERECEIIDVNFYQQISLNYSKYLTRVTSHDSEAIKYWILFVDVFKMLHVTMCIIRQ